MLPLAWQGEVVPPAASKEKGKGNQKDKEAGWMQPRLGGCYKSGKDYRPPITTEWFCIAFCGWVVFLLFGGRCRIPRLGASCSMSSKSPTVLGFKSPTDMRAASIIIYYLD